MELDRLFKIFLNALNYIDQSYFETTYRNVSELRGALGDRGVFRDDDFVRAGERIFCYELYHQFQTRIAREKKINPEFLGNARIQGEVQKWQVIELVNHLGLQALTREFIPDLLVHVPGDATYQACVIEVKCMPEVSRSQVWSDIRKIIEFVTSFQYESGIFLAVNASQQRINEILRAPNNNFEELNGLERISVVCKTAAFEPPVIWKFFEGQFRAV